MIIPEIAWRRKTGEPLESPGVVKVIGPEGGLPNFDDGFWQGMPLGGIGAGTFSQTYRGDFSRWHLEIGKHIYKTLFGCQFGIYENGKAFILNELKPHDGTLSDWNFIKPNGVYHALYPTAYFEYRDLNIIQEQFSPIIPHNYEETSFPVAVFRWHISNPTNSQRELSILWSWENIFGSNENVFYQENYFSGIIFDNLSEEKSYKHGQMGIFVEKTNDLDISHINYFSLLGSGKELWETFSKNGALIPHSKTSEKHKNSPAAISARVKLNPNENKTVTFILVWDFPILESGFGTKWYKRYTKFFGRDGRNISKIARKAFGHYEKWLTEIKSWQREFLKINKPDWFKSMLLNELYFLADGGTIWTCGNDKSSIIKHEEHFSSLECYDYPFYETLDVRFYGSFPLLKLWPELEKVVLKDYIKTVSQEDKEKRLFDHPLDRSTAERKLKGAVPHDLGAPFEDPFIRVNSYSHVNINFWKDLNSKFVLLIYRYFYFTGKKDIDFLKGAWDSVCLAIDYLKKFDRDNDCLIENDDLPDQTFDNWVMKGPSTYCNGLWLAALKAASEMAKVIDKKSLPYENWFEIGRKNLESKLWNGSYYNYDAESEYKESIMADQLCGQWYSDLLELGDILKKDRVEKVLRKIFELNVMKAGNGLVGAINGINPDGTFLPESKVWKLNTQSNEIWSGVTFALANHMERRGLTQESLKTAYGVYDIVYEKKGYWFRTPEAWDINGNFRASLYQRPGAIWSFLF